MRFKYKTYIVYLIWIILLISYSIASSEFRWNRWQSTLVTFTSAFVVHVIVRKMYHRHYGIIYYDQSNFDQAIVANDNAIILDPKDALAHFNRGVAYHHKGMLDRAIEDYNQALALKPERACVPLVYNNLGTALFKKEVYDQAIDYYTKALKIKPKNANSYYGRGEAYAAKGLTSNALADFKMFLKYAESKDSRIEEAQKHIRELSG